MMDIERIRKLIYIERAKDSLDTLCWIFVIIPLFIVAISIVFAGYTWNLKVFTGGVVLFVVVCIFSELHDRLKEKLDKEEERLKVN